MGAALLGDWGHVAKALERQLAAVAETVPVPSA